MRLGTSLSGVWNHFSPPRWLVLVSAALLASVAFAAKPGGGGGGTGPGGVVYFSYTGGLWSMSGNDGFGKTQLNMEGNPSERTYGGRRWFLQRRSPADGVVETWAVRDDGAEQLLPVDMDLETTLWWGPGDVLVGIGRRWMLDGNVDPTSCGVYLADIEFDAAGDIVSYVPPALYAPLDVIVDDEGQAQVDIRWGCDISPDLTRLVQTRVSGPGLWVTDLLTGDSQQITTEGASLPVWSPAGNVIAFESSLETYGSIATINVDGTNRHALVRASWREWVSIVGWSPSGSHLAYHTTSKEFTKNIPDEIYRISVTGGDKVNLTADIGGWYGNVIWRQ